MKKILSLFLLLGPFLWGQNFFEAENDDQYPSSGFQQPSVFYEEESESSFFNNWNPDVEDYEEYYDEPDMGVDSGGNPGEPVPIDQATAVLLIAGLVLGCVFGFRLVPAKARA